MPQSLINLISSRHSTRAFLPTPIPHPLLETTLSLAQHTPSNSNLQPWRVKVVTGNALQRLTSALISTVNSGVPPTTPPIPEVYRHYRSALGKQLYGPEGYDIPRSDTERLRAAQMRNYKFFDAPCALIIYMDRSLSQVDVVSTGMYLQTVCLLLAEQGIATCVQASVAGYGQVIQRELGLDEDVEVLVGVAVGFEDGGQGINRVRPEREGLERNVEFADE